MNILDTIKNFALGLTDVAPSKVMFPANPDRKPHSTTSHPQKIGVHRTKNSVKGIGHGPENVSEHPIFRGYHVPRSKYQPRVATPKALRHTVPN